MRVNPSMLPLTRRIKARIRSITRAPDRFTLSDEEWEQAIALATRDMPENLPDYPVEGPTVADAEYWQPWKRRDDA